MSQQLHQRNRSNRQGRERRNGTVTRARRSIGGMVCPGCDVNFPQFTNKNQLIGRHMERTDCARYIIYCPSDLCNQKFHKESALNRHLSSNNTCRIAEEQQNKISSFSCTSVAVPTCLETEPSSSRTSKSPEIMLTKNNMFMLYDLTDRRATKCSIVANRKRNITASSVIDPNNNSKHCRNRMDSSHCNLSKDTYHLQTQIRTTEPHSSSSLSSLAPRNNINVTSKPSSQQSNARNARARARNMKRRKYFNNIDSEDNDESSDDEECCIDDGDCESQYNQDTDNVIDNVIDTELEEQTVQISQNREENIENNTHKETTDNNRSSTDANNNQLEGDNTTASEPSSIFVDMKNTADTEKEIRCEDKDFKNAIQLLSIMISKKISLHRYNDFMKWRYGCGYKFPNFEQTIKLATQNLYGQSLASKMAPVISMVKLPSERSAPLVVFNVNAMVYDLLCSSDITCRDSMIFDKTSLNPFHVQDTEDYGDFDSSTYYTETIKAMNIDTEDAVICPIVLYIDEIKLDCFGKLGLEPVVMSLMIYNRQTRNTAKAWRVIGYLPNFGSIFGKRSYTANQKAEDYHYCLGKIIDGIRDLQQNKHGHLWSFSFTDDDGNNTSHTRKLHFPLAYVIGDAKGNDLLCGRYGSHYNTTCVGRDCDARTATCDDPSVRCNFLCMNKIELMEQGELRAISFRKLRKNAFSGIWFGAQPYGINGCVPAEPLHQINLGILERLPASFFARLSAKLLNILDRHVGFTCTHFYRQSDRSLPDMASFTSGVSEAKRLTGREKLSRVFVIYLVLLTQEFEEEIVGSHGRDVNASINLEEDEDTEMERTSIITMEEYNKWVNVFEETLLLTSWIYNAQHSKIFFNGGRNSIAAKRIVRFVNMYRESAPRSTGMGLKIVKFHQLLHLWWIIKLYGSLLNVDGARGESNAIVLTKQPGLHTQRRHLLLNLQTASERFNRDIILKCYSEMSIFNSENEELHDNNNGDNTGLDNFKDPSGSKFNVEFDYNSNSLKTKWKSPKMKGKQCYFPKKINAAVFQKLGFYNGGHPSKRIASVEGFTEVKVKYSHEGDISNDSTLKETDLHTIRACPSFCMSRPWFDWAIVKWLSNHEGEEEQTSQYIEAQVIMMLDMTTIEFEDCPPPTNSNRLLTTTPHSLIPSLQIAFVHSAKETKTNMSPAGRTSALASWMAMEDGYQMVDLKCLDRPCFVIVDKFNNNHNGKFVAGEATDIISLVPKHFWSKQFLDYNDNDLKERAMFNRDDDVVDEALKPFET